jgi:hypothetical protein
VSSESAGGVMDHDEEMDGGPSGVLVGGAGGGLGLEGQSAIRGTWRRVRLTVSFLEAKLVVSVSARDPLYL